MLPGAPMGEVQTGGTIGVEAMGTETELTYHQILGGVFPFIRPVCQGALEKEVAVKCFSGGCRRCLSGFS